MDLEQARPLVIWDSNVFTWVMERCEPADLPLLRDMLDRVGLRPWLTPVNLAELAVTADPVRRTGLLRTAARLVAPHLLKPPEYFIRAGVALGTRDPRLAGWCEDFEHCFVDERADLYAECLQREDLTPIIEALPELKRLPMLKAAERFLRAFARRGIVVPDCLFGLLPPSMSDLEASEDYFSQLARSINEATDLTEHPGTRLQRTVEAFFTQLAVELTLFPGNLHQMWEALGLPTPEARMDYARRQFHDLNSLGVLAQLVGMMSHQDGRKYQRGDLCDRQQGPYLLLGAKWVTADRDVLEYAATVPKLRRDRLVVSYEDAVQPLLGAA